MKKYLTAAALFLALCLTAALASGGDAGDPLVSLSYLEGSFSRTLDETIAARMDAADQEIRDAVRQRPDGGDPGVLPPDPAPLSGENITLKEGDVLSGSTGLSFLALGGGVHLNIAGGAVVDVTGGSEAASGPLKTGHRYIAAENAAVSFTVTSPAAVVSWTGSGTLTRSARPDYFAIAAALRSLDLFRGSGSGVGGGFDLHLAPTRGEGLVMFLRILGEEADALACGYSHPFTDVPAWLNPYVAWAYQKGYSNGVSAVRFDPDQPITAQEYVELLLRALGYSTAGVDDYSTSLERALDCGALTNGEYVALGEPPFCRAHVAYISYYSLDMTVSGTRQTLARRMMDQGLLTEEQLAAARSQVETLRLT